VSSTFGWDYDRHIIVALATPGTVGVVTGHNCKVSLFASQIFSTRDPAGTGLHSMSLDAFRVALSIKENKDAKTKTNPEFGKAQATAFAGDPLRRCW
jgi:hypothetical protein